jgi:hypothetical protein
LAFLAWGAADLAAPVAVALLLVAVVSYTAFDSGTVGPGTGLGATLAGAVSTQRTLVLRCAGLLGVGNRLTTAGELFGGAPLVLKVTFVSLGDIKASDLFFCLD